MEEGSDATRTTARGPGLCQRLGQGAEATVHQIQSVASIRAAIGSQRPHPVAQPSSFLRKIIKAERKLLAGWGALSHRRAPAWARQGFGPAGEGRGFPVLIPRLLLPQTLTPLPSIRHLASPDKTLLPGSTVPTDTFQHHLVPGSRHSSWQIHLNQRDRKS